MHSESVDVQDERTLLVISEDIMDEGVVSTLRDARALSRLDAVPDGSSVADPVEARVGAPVDETKPDFELTGLSL